jgi:tripartite-type tricarboxylate transporter receptor subunit TctC
MDRARRRLSAHGITAIHPFAPGRGADIVIRFFADRLSRLSGQSVVVSDKPGARGSVASLALARAKPDGYTRSAALSRKLGRAS